VRARGRRMGRLGGARRAFRVRGGDGAAAPSGRKDRPDVRAAADGRRDLDRAGGRCPGELARRPRRRLLLTRAALTSPPASPSPCDDRPPARSPPPPPSSPPAP